MQLFQTTKTAGKTAKACEARPVLNLGSEATREHQAKIKMPELTLGQNAQTAADLPGSLIIMGVVAVLTFQIAVNVGMVIGFMPVTGIPLPLMSYGGSSVLFTFLALGAAMNVRMRRFVN